MYTINIDYDRRMADMDGRDVSFVVSQCDLDDVQYLADVLREMGLDVVFEHPGPYRRTAEFAIRNLPDKWDARRMRTRDAGRPSTGIHPPDNSIFNSDSTCAEFLAWQENHTAAEGMDALGLTPATYYRRLKSIRERVAEEEKVNAIRKADPTWDGGFVSVRLGDIR